MQQICPQAVPPQPNQWTAGRPAAHRLFGIRAQKTPQEKPRPEQKYPRDQRKIIRRIEARAGQAKRKQKRHAVQLARRSNSCSSPMPRYPIGTLRRNKNNTKEAMAPGSAGARSKKRRSSALSSTAAPNQVQNAEQYLLRRHHQHRNGREQKSAAKCDRATAYRMLPIRKHSPRQQNERPTDELLPDMRVARLRKPCRRSAEYIDPVVNARVYGHIYQCKTAQGIERRDSPRGGRAIFPARLYSTSVTHSAP